VVSIDGARHGAVSATETSILALAKLASIHRIREDAGYQKQKQTEKSCSLNHLLDSD